MTALATAVFVGSQNASAAVITFDDGAVAATSVLAGQYAAAGATFSPGAGGATGLTPSVLGLGTFATNTNMIIVSSTGADVGGGVAAPASGLLLRSFNAWLSEDGDPLFRIDFSSPISAFSATFAGVSDLTSSRIFTVSAANVATAAGVTTATGTSTVTAVLATPVSSIIITPGDYDDWVGIDNITFTAVPEPTSLAVLGVAAVGLVSRRRRQTA